MLAILAIAFLPFSCAFPQTPMENSNYKEEIVHISIKTPVPDHQRDRRDVRNLYPTIDVIIKTTENDVIQLSLNRKKRETVDPPVYSATRNGFLKDDIRLSTEEKSFYQNKANNAVLTVKRKNGTVNELYGSFVRDGTLHIIEPLTLSDSETVSDDVIPHKMSKMDVMVDYKRDAIVLDDDTRNNVIGSAKYRRRRQVGKPRDLYVEYGIVADYKNYQMWYNAVSTGVDNNLRDIYTKAKMVEFYEHVVNSIDVIFKTTHSEKYNIHVVFAGIIIFNDTWTPPWTDRYATCEGCDTVNDFLVLQQFSEWSSQYLQKIIPHDHAALFTGFDLYYKERETHKTVGLSYLSKMCGNWSVSVVEEKRNAITVHIAAHELGHNFGARHDGRNGAEFCSESDLYLMASKVSNVNDSSKSGNPWTFSPCSLSSIYNYIDKLTRDRKNCLLGVPQLVDLRFAVSPGLTYTADYQCQAMFGNQSRVCRNYHFNNWQRVCFGLACWDQKESMCKVIFPHDGTPCGNKKWCQQGSCVQSSNALPVDEYCPFGDNPFYTCAQSECTLSNTHPGDCCSTCKHLYETTTTITSTPSTVKTTSSSVSSPSTVSQTTVHLTQTSSLATKLSTIPASVSTKLQRTTTTVKSQDDVTQSTPTTPSSTPDTFSTTGDSKTNASTVKPTTLVSTTKSNKGGNVWTQTTEPTGLRTSATTIDPNNVTESSTIKMTSSMTSEGQGPTMTATYSSSPSQTTRTPTFTRDSKAINTSTSSPVQQIKIFTPEMEAKLGVFMSLTMIF